MSSIGARPLDAPFGVRLEFDPSRPLSGSQQAELRALFDEHQLLVLDRHQMTREDQERLVSYLGPVLQSDRTGLVSNVDPSGILGDLELTFHSDLSFTTEPFAGLSLYAQDVEDGRTSTRFASAIRAYAELPDRIKREVEGRECVHVYSYEPGGHDRNDQSRLRDASRPRAIHPVVMEHPRTGTKLIYACLHQTDHIVGLDRAASNALLDELFEHLYVAENLYEHWWHRHDLVIWDNLSLQHARSKTGNRRRTLRRVVMGEHDLLEILPGFTPAPRAQTGPR